MSVEIIRYAFVAGELAPSLWGRGDLEKFDLGLALAYNFYVDYRGGFTSRPGQQFIDFVKNDTQETKFFSFEFGTGLADTYVLLFGHQYIRFIQDGAYVLEDPVTITGVTKATPGVVTAAAHGFENGDWVKISGIVGMTELNGRTFEVANKTTNTFQIIPVPSSTALDTTTYTAYSSDGTASRIYTVISPYNASDLSNLRAYQIRDTVRLTHLDYAVRNLVRNDHTDWEISETEFGNNRPRPTGLNITGRPDSDEADRSGTTGCVTAIFEDGEESLPSDLDYVIDIANWTTQADEVMKMAWDPTPGAIAYHAYRSSVVPRDMNGVTFAARVGFIGKTFGPQISDNNIIADYTITPPVYINPFANNAIEYIQVNNGGSGYQRQSQLTVTDPTGTGFVGYPVVNPDTGRVDSVVIVNGGENYTNPSVSVSAGTGATFTVTRTPASGNNPSVSAVFQQRQIYAATDNEPLTLWASKPGKLNNFDESQIIVEDDGYEFELDVTQINPIKHLLPTRSGMLVMTQKTISLLYGGSSDQAVTPLNALADPHSYTGVSDLPPVPIDSDFLYVEGKGKTIRLLSYTELGKVWSGADVSIYSNHFFNPDHRLLSWSYASDPFKMVWAIRSDGALLGLTLVKDEKIAAWTQHWTQGQYKDVITIQEDDIDATYLMVRRYLNGRWTKVIEKQASRIIDNVEDAFCVDCGLQLESTSPAADLDAVDDADEVVFTASAAVFTSGDVGKVLRAAGGKAYITAFTSATVVRGTWVRTPSNDPPHIRLVPETEEGRMMTQASGTWTLDAEVTTVGGLWHLEGETVQVLADGHPLPSAVVQNGQISLGVDASRVVVGLKYTCKAQTLPLILGGEPIEDKRKRIVGVATRINQTTALKVGRSFDSLYSMNDRPGSVVLGEPNPLRTELEYTMVEPNWEIEGQICYQVEDPLPASVVGIILQTEIGDDFMDRGRV